MCGEPTDHGGWAAILMNDVKKLELSGGETSTTNNAMELKAIIRALQALKVPSEVDLYSDSAYVVNAINENWVYSWKRNGWRNSNRKPVANQNLWLELDRLTKIHRVYFYKVKGHSDNEYNNRCDELAVAESKKYSLLEEQINDVKNYLTHKMV